MVEDGVRAGGYVLDRVPRVQLQGAGVVADPDAVVVIVRVVVGADAVGGQAGTDCLYSGGFGFTFKVARLRRTSSLPASSVKVTFTLIFLPTTASVAV